QPRPAPKPSAPEAKRSEGSSIPVMPPPQGTYAEKFSRIMALKRAATPEAIGEIVAALGDADENVRWLASSTLVSLKDERVVAAVRAFAARTESENGRTAAQQVLARLSALG
ncbi:MAG: HEAT repeat domain-containing protein, partial [Oscillatoria sp. Prado101]|nr:HEAT repeat domain-containing protein [Oscillatoria sp. Prado101]